MSLLFDDRHFPLRFTLAFCTALFFLTSALTALAQENECTKNTEVFYWQIPDHIFAMTHGGNQAVIPVPADIATLEGTSIEEQLFIGTFIANEKGEIVGTASEIEAFEQPMTAAAVHDTVWTLLIKDRGSLIAHEIEASSEKTLQFYKTLAESKKPWTGEFEASGTIGPAKNGLGVIIGGTGEFEGATGYMKEDHLFTKVDGLDYEVTNILTFYFCE